jgi:two-component system, OmpR family, phosphate regulon sensor histidine kinase PhoR
MSINFSHLSVCKSALDFNKHELELNQLLHDIKSPLSTLNLCMSHIENTNQNTNSEEAVTILKMALERICSLVTEKKSAANFLMTESVIEIATELQFLNKLDVQIQISKTKDEYFGDAEQLKTIIQNIANNSMNAGASVLIFKSTDMNDLTKIEITDNGRGIDKKILPYVGKVGMSFQQTTDLKNDKGQGLGLSSAVEILKSWGGELFVTSDSLAGTTITLSIPKIPTTYF